MHAASNAVSNGDFVIYVAYVTYVTYVAYVAYVAHATVTYAT